MKQDENHIDQFFRQRIENAEVKAPEGAWNQIARSLDNQKKRRIIYFRRWLAAAASVLLLLSIGFGYLIRNNGPQTPDIQNHFNEPGSTHTDTSSIINEATQPEKPEIKEAEAERPKVSDIETKAVNIKPLSENRSVSNETTREKIMLQAVAFLVTEQFIINIELPSNLDKKQKDAWINYLKQKAFDQLLIDQALIADASMADPEVNRWSLGGEIAPATNNLSQSGRSAFYGAANDMISELTYMQPSEENISAYSGGLAVAYNFSQKWSLQSGLYYFKQAQEIENFTVLSNRAALNNILTSNSNSGIIEFSTPSILTSNNPVYQTELDANNQISRFDDALVQQFEFIEIPFILKYKVNSNKFGIFLLGGFDANILIRNSVFIGKESKQSVGQTNDINSLIYKTALGLSLEYPISRNLYFSLSPVFKYQLTPISKENANGNSTNFIEYRTGISYRF